MNPRLAWSLAGVVAVATVVFLVYGTHAFTIVQRIAFRAF